MTQILIDTNILIYLFDQNEPEKMKRARDVLDYLERIRAEEDAMYQDKLILTVEDNLATCNQRLANFRQAKGSHELLELEIDRLENKIQTISEMAINRAEPDEIVAQVDEVADSMIETEETMNELQFATNLIFEDEVVPKLMVEQQGV